MERVKTGIYGLDTLLGGGYRARSVNAVLGTTGVGKTIYGIQFILYGLNRGESGVYISVEMTEEDFISECEQMGWKEAERYIEEGKLTVHQVYAEDTVFLVKDLIGMIEAGCGEKNRIVIDSLTPFIFRSDTKRRKGIAEFFRKLRYLGTSVVTLEEPFLDSGGGFEDATVPILLSDSVIRMQNVGYGELFSRTLRIVKHRGSHHGEGIYPYYIERGLGIVVEASESEIRQVMPKEEYSKEFKRAIDVIKKKAPENLKEILINRLKESSVSWVRSESPENTLKLFLESELGDHE